MLSPGFFFMMLSGISSTGTTCPGHHLHNVGEMNAIISTATNPTHVGETNAIISTATNPTH